MGSDHPKGSWNFSIEDADLKKTDYCLEWCDAQQGIRWLQGRYNVCKRFHSHRMPDAELLP